MKGVVHPVGEEDEEFWSEGLSPRKDQKHCGHSSAEAHFKLHSGLASPDGDVVGPLAVPQGPHTLHAVVQRVLQPGGRIWQIMI